MADKKSAPVVRRKERLAADKPKEAAAPEAETFLDMSDRAQRRLKSREARHTANAQAPPADDETAVNGATNGATNGDANGDAIEVDEDGNPVETAKKEPIVLTPFDIISGNRIDPFFYKFQFKNVEYSSGRNKTFLCYLVDPGTDGLLMRGYMEDEHLFDHVEEAFFKEILPYYNPKHKYVVTWYMSSSPCAACLTKVAEILKVRKTVRMTIFSARLFNWEEPEIQAGLKALAAAGCKLRMMKPLDFTYTWDTFVENDNDTFTLWEDCQENYEFYHEKLAEILES